MWRAMQSIFGLFSRLIQRQRATIGQSAPNDESAADPLRIRMVAVLGSSQDRYLLYEISERNHWEVFFAETQEQARQMSDQLKPAIILFDRDVVGADWRDAVSSLASVSAGGCVLLISRVADEYLWNEIVSVGGYDLLHKPLNEKDLSRAIKLAWSYWRGMRRPAVLAKK